MSVLMINAECNLVCYVHQSVIITIVVHSVFQAFYLSCHFLLVITLWTPVSEMILLVRLIDHHNFESSFITG